MLHGVVVRRSYASAHPEVLGAFLQAQLDATDFLNAKPLDAARVVAQALDLADPEKRDGLLRYLTRWWGRDGD